MMQLGKKTDYISTYTPELLDPIPRRLKREEIGVSEPLPFYGVDIWNGYELSWLNSKGKPEVMIGEFMIPVDSKNMIESKSFKLYLNSLSQTTFSSVEVVVERLIHDLSLATESNVKVNLYKLDDEKFMQVVKFSGLCIDHQDVRCETYEVNPSLLKTHQERVTETLYSNLLKSNCLVTNQPDWGSIQIRYSGPKIDHAGLLQYIVSFREHNEFHEQCVERIFMDISHHCQPDELTVYARYTRRGGLDINPYRSTRPGRILNQRLVRQ